MQVSIFSTILKAEIRIFNKTNLPIKFISVCICAECIHIFEINQNCEILKRGGVNIVTSIFGHSGNCTREPESCCSVDVCFESRLRVKMQRVLSCVPG